MASSDESQDEFHNQVEVLFLYLIHQTVEQRALVDKEGINLLVVILIKDIRAHIKDTQWIKFAWVG
jgi:hypothetical protein